MSYDGSPVRAGEEPTGPPALTVAAVARRLGVAPTTLRTWDRRYGLGPSARVSGAHRRYTPEDVARLDTMRRLVLTGVTPAEAARVALAGGDGRLPGPSAGGPETPLASPFPAAPHRFAGTGGRVLSIARASPRTRGLARAAMSLDADSVTIALEEALDQDGVVTTWEGLLRPLLVAIGERWQQTGEGIDVEHLLSECTVRALHRRPATPRPPVNARPVLLASAPGDTHMLPLLVLGAALAEQRISTRLLGADTPVMALHSAVRRSGPAAVVILSVMSGTGDPTVFDAVPRLRPPTQIIAAGVGWPTPLPDDVRHATSLRHALDLVGTAVHG